MTESERLRMRGLVKEAEGFRASLYEDSLGYLTIGYGRMLDPDHGGQISRDEAEYLLANDLRKAERQCEELPHYHDLSPRRQAVLIEMCFNLGFDGLKRFRKVHDAIAHQAYDEAAAEMLNSKWAQQVKGRAVRLAEQMRTG